MTSVLPTVRYADGADVELAQAPQPGTVTLDSPAMSVMTDLTEVRAAWVSPWTSLAQAELKMIHQGVRLLFVVAEMPRLDGIVTAADLAGEQPVRLMHQRNVGFGELTVADVMHRLSTLDTVDYRVIGRATVGNVVATLQKFGRRHLLVCESAAGAPPRVRGLVSLTQVERQLGAALPTLEVATTFSEIREALA